MQRNDKNKCDNKNITTQSMCSIFNALNRFVIIDFAGWEPTHSAQILWDKDPQFRRPWLRANKISLNAAKTEAILFCGVRKSISYDIKLVLENSRLKLSSSVKYLGIHLDEHLPWSVNVTFLATKLRTTNGILSKLRYYIPLNTILPIYYAIFHSHFSYAAYGANS